MYEFIGIILILYLTWKLREKTGYIIIAYTLSLAAIAWYNKDPTQWFLSMSVCIFFFTITNVYSLSRNTFLLESYKDMPVNTQCCIPKFGWSSTESVLFLMCSFRSMAGLMAVVSCYVSWSMRERFWTGYHLPVSVCWSATALMWICSSIPHVVCLLQCAASKETPMILKFRSHISIWLVHDIVLGVFWMYLGVVLQDFAENHDESEWRIIFLSMISWHIVIFIVRQLYFSEIWTSTKHATCCAPETRGRWANLVMLSSLVVVYSVVLNVLQVTVSMGCSISQLIIFICAVCCGCLSKMLKTSEKVQKPYEKVQKYPVTALDF